jgi:hypothetical protein
MGPCLVDGLTSGRKWDFLDETELYRVYGLHRRAMVSNLQRRIGECGQRRVSLREWETDLFKRNVSSTSPSVHPSQSEELCLRVTLSPIRLED